MISLGISTCPNDTFIYQNLIEGKVKTPCPISVEYADVQTLNEKVLKGELDMAKVSCAVYPLIKDKYSVLNSGGAMGYGCGPLLLSSCTAKNLNQNFQYICQASKQLRQLCSIFGLKKQSTPRKF